VTEDDLLSAVLDLCKVYGWRTLHIRPARTDKGWRSPVQGDGKGFPDLLLLKNGRVILAELKDARGKVSDDQWKWLDEGMDLSRVWRPADWHSGEILRVLSA
jgi:hypothetical protein